MKHKIDKLLAAAINLRDYKTKLDREHKEKVKDLKPSQEKLELAMQAVMNEAGVDNMKVRGVGTVFTTKKDSVTATDKEKLQRFLATKMLLKLQGYHYQTQQGEWQPEGEADLEEHIDRILDSGAFDLLTVAPNKTNCKSYMENNEGHMPDGVEYYQEVVVQFRK
ncbi:MAG: hypothetical protein GY746_02745 [Gammaproteobacteria bacterium]|nr:hypothetical protein [Gammaproteobacteria bacterium]